MLLFIQGVAFASDFAAIGLITVQWASLKQNAVFIAMLTSFSQFAVIFTNPIAGVVKICITKVLHHTPRIFA
jgi:hypothetical protein